MLTISSFCCWIFVICKMHWAFKLTLVCLVQPPTGPLIRLPAHPKQWDNRRQSLTLIEVDEVLPFLAVSGATILGPLHYVCTSADVVAYGEAFKAALAVPDGLSRLTDLLRGAGMWNQNYLSLNSRLRLLCSNYENGGAHHRLNRSSPHLLWISGNISAQILTPPGPVLVSLVCW